MQACYEESVSCLSVSCEATKEAVHVMNDGRNTTNLHVQAFVCPLFHNGYLLSFPDILTSSCIQESRLSSCGEDIRLLSNCLVKLLCEPSMVSSLKHCRSTISGLTAKLQVGA